MNHADREQVAPENDWIPDFLLNVNRQPGEQSPERESVPMFKRMSAPVFAKADDEGVEATETEAPAPAVKTPAKAPAKAKGERKAKPAGKVAAKGNGHAKPTVKAKGKAPVKAAAKTPAKAKGASKAKGTDKAPRQRDPAKLDGYGFRLGTTKSKAAALYAKGKGATLAEVKAEVGSVQFNLLTELEAAGWAIEKSEVKNDGGRKVTRYKIRAKD